RRLRQAANGRERGSRNEKPERCRQRYAANRDQEEKESDTGKRVLHLAKRARNLKRIAIPGEILHRHGKHANLRVAHVRIREGRRGSSLRDLQGVVANRERACFVRRTKGLAVRADELNVARWADHRARNVDVRAAAWRPLEVRWPLRDRLRLLPERVVDRPEQLIADDD